MTARNPADLIRLRLSEILDQNISVDAFYPLSGGSINEAFQIETSAGPYFLKYNDASRYPGMFHKEAKGLSLLKLAAEVDVPTVIEAGETGNYSFLLLNYIEAAPKRIDFWESFGFALARLHKHSNDFFGLDHDNYIGSLPQINNKHRDWNSFFVTERLERQVKMAQEQGLIGRSVVSRFEKLYARLSQIMPVEAASLIHGDLWTGNYMTGANGQAVIIDPAVYYGHREMDIGMSRLFGSFDPSFYDAYNQEYPMEPGWRERVDICNLYPLMVHVNLFGSSYVASVENILRRF
ncbi:MAG: fructosamine kinase family protein [Bacteroidota bacterium]|nr:fructosamine kinase family protein [Bacteroidota bacterium]